MEQTSQKPSAWHCDLHLIIWLLPNEAHGGKKKTQQASHPPFKYECEKNNNNKNNEFIIHYFSEFNDIFLQVALSI
jgi:hypothetical protein